MSPHPLLEVLLAASEGTFPSEDGGAVLVPPLSEGLEAVVSFTGHAFVATSLTQDELADLDLDGFGAALHPAVLLRLAGPQGNVGVVDATLVGRGLGGGDLPARTDLGDHPRVQHAASLRRQVRVHGDVRGLVTLAEGLAGRSEMSVEVAPGRGGAGTGRGLVRDALRLLPEGEPVFAAVSPGNARSLRVFLALGFEPVGSEVLIKPGRRTAPAEVVTDSSRSDEAVHVAVRGAGTAPGLPCGRGSRPELHWSVTAPDGPTFMVVEADEVDVETLFTFSLDVVADGGAGRTSAR